MFTFFFQLLRECRVGALMREFVLDHCDSGSILRLTWGLYLVCPLIFECGYFGAFPFDLPSFEAVCFAINFLTFPQLKKLLSSVSLAVDIFFNTRASL